jgi:hypothetical protein
MKYIFLILNIIIASTSLIAQKIKISEKPWLLRNSKISIGLGFSEPEKRYRTYGEDDIENRVLDWDISVTIEKNIIQFGRLNMTAGLGYGWANSNFNRYGSSQYINYYDLTCRLAMLPKLYTKHLLVAPIRMNFDVVRWNKKNSIFLNGSVLPSICFYKWVKRFPCNGGKPKGRFLFDIEEIEFNPGIGFRRGYFEYMINYRVANFSKKYPFYFGTSTAADAGFLEEPNEWHNPTKLWLTVSMCFGQ